MTKTVLITGALGNLGTKLRDHFATLGWTQRLLDIDAGGDPAIIAALAAAGPYDLVTGTPPYFPPSTALDAEDPQRAYARIEYRGGVEAYLTTASHLLSNDGIFVLCGDYHAEPRVLSAAAPLGLHLEQRLDVIPRTREPVLFSAWTLTRSPPPNPTTTRITLRDAKGQPTPDADRLRAFSGFAARQ